MLPPAISETTRRTLVDYLRTTFRLRGRELDSALFAFLNDHSRGMFRGPYLDIRLPFRVDANAESPIALRPPFPPFAHQLRAWQRLTTVPPHRPQSTLVTTGTGSGKTECFLYPIVDHCLRQHELGNRHGIKAILLYPMNALATDQAERIAKLLHDDTRLRGKVRAGLYVGGDPDHPQTTTTATKLIDDRETLRHAPPDILLTNYRMLDFLLMRPEDGKLWQHNGPDTLQYLVLDELHTYDGAQGSDVACLIRRLRHRLHTPEAHLCCVGTSATIGSGSAEARDILVKFASDVFGCPFDADSLVGEDRITVDEFFEHVKKEMVDRIPDLRSWDPANDPLDPQRKAVPDPAEYLDLQAEMWLGHSARDPVAVGETLQKHAFLQELLRAIHMARHRPPTLLELAQTLAADGGPLADVPAERRQLAIASFVSLVCHARAQEGDKQRPFLHVQVQTWIRELRHLLRKVDDGPVELAWRDEVQKDDGSKWLPIVYCRECGYDGYGAMIREGETKILDDDRQIGEAYLRRRRSARFLVLGEAAQPTALAGDGVPEQLETPHYLCKRCLSYSPGNEKCGHTDCPGRSIPARAHSKLSENKNFLAECPRCGASDGLSMLGSRAASLSSVAVSHLFLSPFNDDPKLLAFTDSVQDASHRAGFFAARTFRFGLRTAIQSTLEGGPPVPLASFVDRFFERWIGMGERKFVATFTPPDLQEHPDYEKYIETAPDKSPSKREREAVLEMLRQRISWEVTREYGLGVVLGRSLEATGCSTLAIDDAALARAGARLAAQLREHRPAQTRQDPTDADATHFLEGLLHRQRRRGGIHHPLLDGYAKTGNTYLLTKRRSPLMSPPGQTPPRFLQLGTRHKVFDPLYSKPTSPNWARDWTARAFDCATRDAGIDDVLRRAIDVLVAEGVVRRIDAGNEATAGIDPKALTVTRDVGIVTCRVCSTDYLLPASTALRWEGHLCLAFRCRGTLTGTRRPHLPVSTYYRDLYKSGRIERIFATEHTGMLAREDREDVERRFKAIGDARAPDAPNLLACTPTLEMGIDIGDLGAAMLCSVPPLASNYLQRVGRAGRKTGNALVLTMASDAPHDQYFFAEPREMLAGDVAPPGCFLDAPDILKRQLVAYAMDCWAVDEPDASGRVPRFMRDVLGPQGKDGFPGNFYAWVDAHRDAVLEGFLALFAAHTKPATVEELRSFAAEGRITGVVHEAFEAVRAERDQLRGRIKELKTRQEQIEAEPSKAIGDDDDPLERQKDELAELEDAKRSFERLEKAEVNKYPLAVLTDFGALPNYAFPETGVTLKSVLQGLARRQDADAELAKTGKRKAAPKQTTEYVRPASQALREFAPFNTFYAEGHKVKVSQIDLGTAANPMTVEWRFCPSCSHVDTLAQGETEPAATCPSCGHPGWADAGQRRRLVNFQRAMSVTNLLESVSDDATEERKRESYRTLELIEAPDPDESHRAYLIDTGKVTFGYELIERVKLREVNFGLRGTTGLTFPVAGGHQVQDGFLVCKHCGKAQDRFAKEKQHAPYCRVRQGRTQEAWDDVYLFREIRSEALRLLLPVSAAYDLREALPSFRAALHLGLRKRFHGYPRHLKITPTSDPVDANNNARRQYLMVYDAVPGGTGYLVDLSRGDVLFQVMQLALDAMRACSCRSAEPMRDGCYRCLYAHQEQHDIPNISRTRAEGLFAQILAHKDEVTQVPSLARVSIDHVLESELEEKFVQELGKWVDAQAGWDWEADVPYELGRCWRIRSPEHSFRLEPQVPVTQKDGDMIVPCRPDFLLRCTSDDSIRTVAIFCDGFRYHVCPEKPVARVHDDLRKRKSLIESERYWSWTVTWKDFPRPDDGGELPTLLEQVNKRHFGEAAARLEGGIIEDAAEANGFGQLLAWLRRPDARAWQNTALALGFGLLGKGPVEAAPIQALRQQLESAPAAFEHEPFVPQDGQPVLLAGTRAKPWARLLVSIKSIATKARQFGAMQFLLRLFDESSKRAAIDFEESWRAFFHAWNVLQFHGAETDVVSSEWLAEEGLAVEVAAAQPVTPAKRRTREVPKIVDEPTLPLEFSALVDDFPELKELLARVHAAELPAPEEFTGLGGGVVEVEALVCWEQQRIAIALEIGEDDARVWSRHGWRAFPYGDIEGILAALQTAFGKKG